jgi:hypothetical protein
MKTSRRTFLQSTAPAIALTWGGLKLYAGNSDEAAGNIRPVPAHDFICGSIDAGRRSFLAGCIQ